MRTLSRIIFAAAIAAIIITPVARAQRVSSDGSPQTFNFLVDKYFDDYFRTSPSAATYAGFHQYDSQLEDYSAAAAVKQTAMLRDYDRKFQAIDPSALDASVRADRDIVLNNIHTTLLTLESIRPLERNPDSYSSSVTNSIYLLMSRNFAPANSRLKSVVEREKLIPQVFVEARKNLKNPAKISVDIALEQLPGLASFFQTDVPAAFADATDPATKAAFAKSNAAVIAAFKSYEAWLRSDVLPHATGDFRIGADTFRKKLLYDEMVDTPLDRLIEIDTVNMRRNQAEFARVAKLVDPTKTPEQVLAQLALIHPDPDKLLSAFQDTFSSLIAFIRTNHIITIPSEVQPVLEETPPFARATTFASMDPPGPFETHSTKAYFNVTLPEKDWTPAHVAEHMASFNVGTIVSTSVHEAYPGHYVQFLWQNQFPSKVRKLLGANTNIEGWAHYCEQMMLDAGYAQPGSPSPSGQGPVSEREANLIRLGQLQDALLRNARFIVGIKMHSGQMSTDEAIAFFVKEGYQSRSVGEVETKRGTADPTYLYYTLGKLEIMKLREDYKAKLGPAFTLQNFHDTLMRQGPVPIKVARKAMLGDDSPVL